MTSSESQPTSRPIRGSLPSKVVALVLAATSLTSAGAGWLWVRAADASLRELSGQLHSLTADHVASQVGPWVQDRRLQLEYLARQASIDLSSCDESRFDGLALFDDQGERLDHWGSVPPEVRNALGRPDRLAPLTLEDGRPAVAIAPRWPGGDRELVAVVALERFAPLLRHELPGEQSLVALTDAEGRVLARSGRLLAEESLEWIELPPPHREGTLQQTEFLGRSALRSTRRLAGLDWNVVVLAPLDSAFGLAAQQTQRALQLAGAGVLLFGLVAWRFARRFLRPIASLAESTDRLARGEPGVSIEDPLTQDEVGLLARSLKALLRTQRLQRREIEHANRHLLEQNADLERTNEMLSQLSITDGLTKLHNHRFFQDHLTREIRRIGRSEQSLAMLILDIDDFKRLNDRLGHAAGDEMLKRIAQILSDAVRASDLCARYGGEEFVVLTPGTDAAGAYELAEKLRTAVAESSFIVDDSMRPVRSTVSIGVAVYAGDRKRFFQKADQALYRAKAQGKNCSIVHEEDWPEELGPLPS